MPASTWGGDAAVNNRVATVHSSVVTNSFAYLHLLSLRQRLRFGRGEVRMFILVDLVVWLMVMAVAVLMVHGGGSGVDLGGAVVDFIGRLADFEQNFQPDWPDLGPTVGWGGMELMVDSGGGIEK
ncbi:Hypothetical predicted protein [Olea europaea subsp. europaea]|uniref:Uncharacterized protein n=1 Tax=Olea europaea subsp. europaea TaxID=158383 RepID=A0A8S0SVM4_OLEEU|nr:Hypothetical predicted protein [Olea europaea subsp. europaea]